jgi:hypothetical protein
MGDRSWMNAKSSRAGRTIIVALSSAGWSSCCQCDHGPAAHIHLPSFGPME